MPRIGGRPFSAGLQGKRYLPLQPAETGSDSAVQRFTAPPQFLEELFPIDGLAALGPGDAAGDLPGDRATGVQLACDAPLECPPKPGGPIIAGSLQAGGSHAGAVGPAWLPANLADPSGLSCC